MKFITTAIALSMVAGVVFACDRDRSTAPASSGYSSPSATTPSTGYGSPGPGTDDEVTGRGRRTEE